MLARVPYWAVTSTAATPLHGIQSQAISRNLNEKTSQWLSRNSIPERKKEVFLIVVPSKAPYAEYAANLASEGPMRPCSATRSSQGLLLTAPSASLLFFPHLGALANARRP